MSAVGQLTFCEIQATISQLASQLAYVAAAFADDRTGGVCVSAYPVMTETERADATKRLALLSDDVATDPLLRRIGGRVAESVELSGTATERRHFDFGAFYVIGCPDAVSAAAVKEFARSRYPHLAIKGKSIQCNLYTALWQRPRGDVVVVSYDDDERLTEVVRGDVAEAEWWLLRAWSLLSGSIAPAAPERLTRCRSCRYNENRGCPVPRGSRVPTLDQMVKIADRFGS